jgi:hypothetical protein
VWNALTARVASIPSGDVDVVYFEAAEGAEARLHIEDRLARRLPTVRWEVTNQAHVHLWYRDGMGRSIAPFRGVLDAMATWPETATAVGARLTRSGGVEVIAPLGLDDLFDLVLRHNPARVDDSAFRARIAEKGWCERWPELTVARPSSTASPEGVLPKIGESV